MKCPVDDTPLSVSSRDGVEIDFCPQCRGVWLVRGELDKIIDLTANAMAAAPVDRRADDRRGDDDRRDYDDRRDDDRRRYDDRRDYDDDRRSDRKRRKRGFLDDLFDFD